MRIALSPYHLSTREAPAFASLLLAEEVFTLMPVPFHGASRDDIENACRRIPRYADFLESWSWSAPLWNAGVIASAIDDDDAIEDVRDALELIHADYASLADLINPEVFRDERAYLAAVTLDIIRGGPDPGINIPITAGLDRFAARRELIAARAEPASVVQKAEAKLATPIARTALPVLVQAEAETIIEAREVLAVELTRLRSAIDFLVFSGGHDSPSSQRPAGGRDSSQSHAADELKHATSAYSDAFNRFFDSLAPDADALQIRAATLSLSIMSLPVSASLSASRSALAAVVSHAPPPLAGNEPSFICCVFKRIGRTSTSRRGRP